MRVSFSGDANVGFHIHISKYDPTTPVSYTHLTLPTIYPV